jgi:uncharacterized protein YyaL (SSP411 family)
MEENISQLPQAWQLAIQREKESFNYYMRMASSTADASLKALFESLAAEEAKHRAQLEQAYRQAFEADMEGAKGRTGTFEHALQTDGPPLISWRDWDEESFRLAQRLDVPVLLSISAVWCHWCHVMDQTTFSDPEVASLVDAYFVPIRVDNDKRPDINARYNMGGWPTVAFLTPEGEIISGGTYMPAAAFKETLRRIGDYYQQNRAELQSRSHQMRSQRLKAQQLAPQSIGELTPLIPDNIYSSIAAGYDAQYGGFGEEPKFPQVDAIELALARFARRGDTQALNIAVATLKAMAQGGIYDHEAGGFFRYSTTRDWTVPHYEKMLEDNARLLSAYLHAYQVTGEVLFRETAQGIVSYIGSTLRDADRGYFYGSQDADEQYYALNRADREKRRAPFVDTHAYTAWNAMMASSYLEAAAVLERPELATAALATVNFLWKDCWLPEGGMCHYWDGEGHLPGLLSDQAWMTHVLLHAYEYTASAEYLHRAQAVATWVLANLATEAGGLQDRPIEPASLGRLGEVEVSIAENAVAAAAFARLARLTGDDTFANSARSALSMFARTYDRYSYFAAGYALAVEQVLAEPLQVVVVGSADDAATLSLLRAAWRPYAANRTVLAVDPTWEPERLKKLGYPAQPIPRAYICVGHTCTEPAADPDQVISNIQRLSKVKDSQ